MTVFDATCFTRPTSYLNAIGACYEWIKEPSHINDKYYHALVLFKVEEPTTVSHLSVELYLNSLNDSSASHEALQKALTKQAKNYLNEKFAFNFTRSKGVF